jgi:phosphoglycolate phosphatase
MSQRLAMFDCDGTLVDGQAAVCNAMEAAFVQCGAPAPDRHLVRRIVGLSLPQAIRTLLPEADEALRGEIDRTYRDTYRAAREAGELVEPLYEGIAALLAGLEGDGWLLGVATGKSLRGLEHCLAMHGLRRHFVTLQTADLHPSKPHPAMLEAALAEAGAAPESAVMIGDTSYDMQMALAAGVRALGVDWGYHSAAELKAAGAAQVAASVDHLKELLQ